MSGNRFSANQSSLVSGTIRERSFIGMVIWAIGLSRRYRKWVVVIVIAMLAETLIGLATPWPLKIIIDNIIENRPLPGWLQWVNEWLPGNNKMQLATLAALSFVLIAALGSVATMIENYYNEKVSQHIANDLRRKLYHHLQNLSLSYYDSHQTGKLLSTITADVSTIQDFASSTLLTILVDALSIVGMLGIMFYLNSDFTLVALAVTPFLLFFVARFKKSMKKATREVRKDQSNMFTILQEGLESMRAVNAFGRQDFEEEKLRKISEETVAAAMRARKAKSVLSPTVTIIVALCTAFVLWHGAGLVLSNAMTVGALTVFLWYMNKFFSPVQDLAKMTSIVAQASIALERIQAILDTDTIIPQKPGAKDPGRLNGEIVFEQVGFSYNNESVVLHDINFTIQRGQRIGICGPTGCGKSTVVSLIPRFYDTTKGRILIDGQDITDLKLDALRAQLAFVLQDTILFYGSVYDNIAYGRPDATREEIIEAAITANAHEFIEKMPHGYDTLVGEKGVMLSGGQRQRIGIARALVRNSPILLLDEPTASLDTESEKLVMDALEKLMEGRTVITIAHRLSTLRDADKIFVMNNGCLAEEGSHEELMKKAGVYAGLYNLQSWTDRSADKITIVDKI
jgi:ABC-type multidrug transport system fused ATPase/permease subunit